jgi:hypothetical protein
MSQVMVSIDYFDGVQVCGAVYIFDDLGADHKNLSEARLCWLDEFEHQDVRYIKAEIVEGRRNEG